ncbi:hypothetical protein BDF14DRAFT_1843433 [Spinellus fusiger]|nr:hypothetical protein BDF14DRAFT_1843433 [Spinellus fusiger]
MRFNMERMPVEIILEIFAHVPLSSFSVLYQLFPCAVVDEALKMTLHKSEPLLSLVSTNLHELQAPYSSHSPHYKNNESSLALHFASFDTAHTSLCFLPNFQSSCYYFKVKNAYVSHGKLVLRPHSSLFQREHCIGSLWDICKHVPPLRAGTFSGATETLQPNTAHDITLHQSDCCVEACLVGPSSPHSCPPPHLRSLLPIEYTRKAPLNTASWGTLPDRTCGYFLVEKVVLPLSAFLALFAA